MTEKNQNAESDQPSVGTIENEKYLNQPSGGMIENEKYLDRALLEYCNSDAYPFHMPGHKRQTMGNWNCEAIDITEITGFDNLHHAEGILLEAQQRAAQTFGADESFFLVNGSTAGLWNGKKRRTAFDGAKLSQSGVPCGIFDGIADRISVSRADGVWYSGQHCSGAGAADAGAVSGYAGGFADISDL